MVFQNFISVVEIIVDRDFFTLGTNIHLWDYTSNTLDKFVVQNNPLILTGQISPTVLFLGPPKEFSFYYRSIILDMSKYLRKF